MRSRFAWLTSPLFAGLLLFASHPCHGQSAGVNQGGSPYIHAPADSTSMPQSNAAPNPVDRMRAAERRRRLLADSEKLALLSAELKATVDQTPPDQISLEIVRKAAAIEKLAHELKQWSTI